MITEQLDILAEEETGILPTRPSHPKYRIPKRTESPGVTGEMTDSWIREFCEWNGLSLPKGFGEKTRMEKIGMYHGMLRTYGIHERDILPQRPERHY